MIKQSFYQLKNYVKTKKAKQKYIVLLKDAFTKAVETEHRNLIRLKKDINPAVIEQIFKTYIALDKRQELIRPLLPLRLIDSDKDVEFQFTDYTNQINDTKATLSDYLYANAKRLLIDHSKESARKAYADLEYLNQINPNFKNTTNLLKEAHFKGTNFVWVQLQNRTNQIIPKRLEDDLLNFNTYGLDKFWTVFHHQKELQINYNYQLELIFNRIDVSPERIQEKQYKLEKEIKDGFEYKTDRNGNVVRDSLGNGIKIDKYIIVSSDFYEVHQEKASHIEAEVVLSEISANTKIVKTIPLHSEFVFMHDFAEMSGDKRALDNYQLDLIRQREIPFPTNEQLIFDTGEDLKNKLKHIIDDLEI